MNKQYGNCGKDAGGKWETTNRSLRTMHGIIILALYPKWVLFIIVLWNPSIRRALRAITTVSDRLQTNFIS